MKPTKLPPQQQPGQPGKETDMDPRPEYIRKDYKGSEKLKGKIALITGGDSGIGRSAAIHFAREGADVAIAHFNEKETEDANETKALIEQEGRKCLLLSGDLKDADFSRKIVRE